MRMPVSRPIVAVPFLPVFAADCSRERDRRNRIRKIRQRRRGITQRVVNRRLIGGPATDGTAVYRLAAGAVIPKSGVKFAVFIQICPKNRHLLREFMQQS
jgi:hypothetical protein